MSDSVSAQATSRSSDAVIAYTILRVRWREHHAPRCEPDCHGPCRVPRVFDPLL